MSYASGVGLDSQPPSEGPVNEYVLVHGAAHGAWCWEDVAKTLEGKGHRVVTLDLPGHGRRAGEARQASVAVYARAVADAMAREAVSRAILVGTPWPAS